MACTVMAQEDGKIRSRGEKQQRKIAPGQFIERVREGRLSWGEAKDE